MARGIKPNPNRNEVRSKSIQIRINQYEYDEIIKSLNLLKDNRSISTFIRDLINDATNEVLKNDCYKHNV